MKAELIALIGLVLVVLGVAGNMFGVYDRQADMVLTVGIATVFIALVKGLPSS